MTVDLEVAGAAVEQLRSAIDDVANPDHRSACAFRSQFGQIDAVERFLAAYDGPAEVERVAEAADVAGLAEGYWADGLNLGLLTLMVDESYRPDPALVAAETCRFVEGEGRAADVGESGEELARRLLREIDDERAIESSSERLERERREQNDATRLAAAERLKGPHIQIG
jgi:hypothetical protein